jgi:hypothetical protein
VSKSDGVQERLYAHVESILNGAAFRRRDRDDLAEELYGHLWQRWQDALASGLHEEAAVDQAIRSFGEPARLGRDVTLAYHSRLYASTIGVLVPTVADAKGKPRGYWLIYFLLFTTFWVMAYGQAEALMSWTPLRAAIGFGGTLTAFIAASLVFQAYRARQRWTLRFAGLELGLLVWWVGLLWWTNSPGLPASLVGAASGLGIVCLAFSWPWRLIPLSSWRDLHLRSLSGWMYERPIPRRLLVGLGAMLVVGSAMPAVALNLADPTQIGAADMQVGLTVTCARSGSGYVSAVDVTASFLFKRTDVWPNGLVDALQRSGPTDEIAWVVEGSRPNGAPMITPMLTRAGTARDTTDGTPLALGSPENRDNRALLTIPDSARLRAGHRYEATWLYSVAPGLRDSDVTPVTFGYDHLERFYLQATAGCGQTATGHTVSQLYVTGP